MKIAIFDYGAGNIFSLKVALEKQNVDVDVITNFDVPNNYSSVLTDLVNRYAYSFYNHARENYLSRKEGGWATDKNNEQFRTVVSMKDLYMEMRKEIPLHTDPLLFLS